MPAARAGRGDLGHQERIVHHSRPPHGTVRARAQRCRSPSPPPHQRSAARQPWQTSVQLGHLLRAGIFHAGLASPIYEPFSHDTDDLSSPFHVSPRDTSTRESERDVPVVRARPIHTTAAHPPRSANRASYLAWFRWPADPPGTDVTGLVVPGLGPVLSCLVWVVLGTLKFDLMEGFGSA